LFQQFKLKLAMNFSQKLFRYIFWSGYFLVFIATFIHIGGDLTKIKLGLKAFQIRLDHLLHLVVYFVICIYYLFGLWSGLTLFNLHSLRKFIFIMMILGTVTEVVQLWVPERTFNVFDLVSNVAGVMIGLAVIEMVQRRKGAKV
jgi:VanZ family protein